MAELMRTSLGLRMVAAFTLDAKRNVLVALTSSGVPPVLQGRLSTVRIEGVPVLAPLLDGSASHVVTTIEEGEVLGERPIRDSAIKGAVVLCFPLGVGTPPEGIMAYALPPGHAPSDEDIEALRQASWLFDLSLHTAGLSATAEDRRDALERALRASTTMLFTAEALAEHHELDEVVRVLAGIVHDVSGGKDVAVWLAQEGGKELVLRHSMGETAAGVGGRLSYDELDPLVYTAIAERRSILVEGGVSPTFISPGFREARARFLVIPLITEGGVLGTIEVNERDSDIATVTSDKQLIEGVAFQAVAAIENARLYERQRRSGQVRSLLSEIDSLLAESLERREVLREVTRLAVVGLQADGGALVLKEGSGWMARYASGEKRWVEREPLGADDLELAAAALRQRAPLLVLQRDEQPGHEHPAQRSGTLVAPLWLHDRVMGALFFTKANWLPVLDNETLDFAARLSSSVSMALGNQRMFEHEHRIAETLQQALLTVPPRLAGVEIAHRYQAATESARVGGDFYDVFEMKDKVVIAIGDVSGKGVDAAAVGSLAKNALRGHILDLGSPSEALRKVNNLIHAFTEPAVFLTAFIGLLDMRTGVLRYASAGHPAPLVLRGAEVIAAEGADMLLGAFEDMVYAQREAHLAPGDMLFLYTDGLVEAPGGEDRYGETRLTDLLRDLRKDDGDQLLTEVFEAVTAFSDGGLEDDVALLAIRPTALRRPRGGRQKR